MVTTNVGRSPRGNAHDYGGPLRLSGEAAADAPSVRGRLDAGAAADLGPQLGRSGHVHGDGEALEEVGDEGRGGPGAP